MANSYKYVQSAIKRRAAWVRTMKTGQRCHDCKATTRPADLDWHHVDAKTKEFRIAWGVFRVSRERILAEISKCVLLCRPCHRTKHKSTAPHGTYARSQVHYAERTIVCAPCRAARTEYVKQRRLRRAA